MRTCSFNLGVLAFGTAAVLAAATSHGQSDYGIDFATIGSPGNRATNSSELPDPAGPLGAVGYEYRVAKDKLSESQYFEFAQAYKPYVTSYEQALDVAGLWLSPYQHSNGSWDFALNPRFANVAAGITWEMSARYCNWLCNEKHTNQAAFESGAYNASTFDRSNPQAYQLQHTPGARFWIPSLDEMTKAIYYDPNRYGTGQGGYWQFPNRSDSVLVQGYPGSGAETIGYLEPTSGHFLGEWDLGQYPDTQTPWGLTDISATLQDWTSTRYFTFPYSVFVTGSYAGSSFYDAQDRIGRQDSGVLFQDSFRGLRIASTVPGPASAEVVTLFVVMFLRNLRSRSKSWVPSYSCP